MRPRFIGVSAFLAMAALLFAALTARAQAPPERVSITGPGLSEPLLVSEPQLLEAFAFDGFKDTDVVAGLPDDTGAAYTITRYVQQDGGAQPYDRLLYLPPGEGQPAYVFYEGLLAPGERSPLQDRWYRVSPDSARVLAGLLPETADDGLFSTGIPFFTVSLAVPALMALAVLAVLALIVYLQRSRMP